MPVLITNSESSDTHAEGVHTESPHTCPVRKGNDTNSWSGRRHSLTPSLEPISDVFRFVNVSYILNKKRILTRVSGAAHSGELFALLGPSGAGKSTLLDILSNGGHDKSGKVASKMLLNEKELNWRRASKHLVGYVEQEDCLISALTTREYLYYQARLRIPGHSEEAIQTRVQELISALQLQKCTDSQISSCSGGEARRISIATELLSKPRILLLDEPTSGLDSFSSIEVMTVLHKLCIEKNLIVMCTIHQPSEKIFELLGKVLLLREGQVCYQGPASQAVNYFEKLGYTFQECYNSAGFLLEIVSSHYPCGSEPSSRKVDKEDDYVYVDCLDDDLVKKWKDASQHAMKAVSKESTLNSGLNSPLYDHVGFSSSGNLSGDKSTRLMFHIIVTLMSRRFLLRRRSGNVVLQALLDTLIYGIVYGTLFLMSSDDAQGQRNKISVLSVSIIEPIVKAFFYVGALYQERPMMNRERGAGLYGMFPYFVALFLEEFPFIVLRSITFVTLTWWPIGFPYVASRFFFYFFLFVVLGIIGLGFGVCTFSIFPTFQVASSFLSLVLPTLTMFSGYLIKRPSIPYHWLWAYYISPANYAVTASLLNNFEDTAIALNQGAPSDSFLGNKWNNVACLVCILTVLYVLGYVLLRCFVYARK